MPEILNSFDPSSDKRIDAVSVSSENEIGTSIASAKDAQAIWRKIPIEKRVEYIEIAYSAAEPEIQRLAELLGREMGKDIRRATAEVHGTIYGGPFIAASARDALRDRQSGRTTIEYVPHGVVAVISPWNYPLAMANNLIVPALVAGNSVIWKPSEETPLIAQAFYNSINEHLPKDILQIIHGDGKQGRMLVEGDVNMVAFTGSQSVGKNIMQRSSAQLKRLVMELGGNDPMIVMADADLHSAARFAVASSFENSGQMCTATERIYVDQTIADKFEELVITYAGKYRVGPWNMDGVNIGPIINRRQHEKILSHIRDAKEKGATLLLGDENQKPPYIHPTIISGMKPDMLIEKEETFGPLVCIDRYSDVGEAVERANSSSYGLGAVIFGSAKADRVANRLEAGMIGVNQGVGGEGDSPWVGAKQSGFGFHGSADGHKQFAQVRIINR